MPKVLFKKAYKGYRPGETRNVVAADALNLAASGYVTVITEEVAKQLATEVPDAELDVDDTPPVKEEVKRIPHPGLDDVKGEPDESDTAGDVKEEPVKEEKKEEVLVSGQGDAPVNEKRVIE